METLRVEATAGSVVRNGDPGFMASAAIGQYWVFVLGFALGAYAGKVGWMTAAMSAVTGLMDAVLGGSAAFLQAGLLLGWLARMGTRKRAAATAPRASNTGASGLAGMLARQA
jgi:hypothetical protein